MVASSLWLAAIGPAVIVAAALAAGTPLAPSARGANRIALGAAFCALGVALASAIAVGIWGTLATPALGVDGVGFGLYLDRLSAAMFCLVSFIGLIVVAYSRNYLDGDPGQVRFTRLLCLTLAAVLLVIVSGNAFQFLLAWIATSMGLHKLLLFYPERPAAAIAARKKFIASRLGDACLVVALVLLHRTFGSLDYGAMFSGAASLRSGGDVPLAIHAVAILLVIAALLKSAQFPLHGWLIEVMETPTPVSALLHAGIINAGGFLVLRFSNVIALSVPSMETLAIAGAITALFGSVVMLTQTSIKVTLAYSTVAQMGFMMLECGLGAFPAALLHIVAHSLYKAHAFLSSGSVIDIARASWTPSPGGKPHPARHLFAIAGVLVVALFVGRLFGASLTQEPGVFALGAVVLLSLIHLVSNGIDERPNAFVVVRTLGLAVVVAVAYFALQLLTARLLSGSFPPPHELDNPVNVAIVAAVVLSFAAVTFLQSLVPGRGGSPRWHAMYAHISNGFYVNTLANRLVLRYWRPGPSNPPREAASR